MPPPPKQAPPSALAAMYAAAEARQQAQALTIGTDFDSSLRVPALGTPRRRPQPQRWPPVPAMPVPPMPVQRRPMGQPSFRPLVEASPSSAYVQPQGDVVRRRPGNASFRGAPCPPMATYCSPALRPNAPASFQPPFATASEVVAYPYMYHAPDLRYEATATAQAVPAQADGTPVQQLSFDNVSKPSFVPNHSYTGVVQAMPVGRSELMLNMGEVPSYAPRALSSRYDPPPSASATPAQGLSLKQMAPGPGVIYPGPAPTRGNTVQFSTAYAGQLIPQVDGYAATTPVVATAPLLGGPPMRGTPQKLSYVQSSNGSTVRYPSATQPVLSAVANPSSLMQSISQPFNFFNQAQPAAYARPSHIPTQVPSFTAPLPAGFPQAQAYAVPQLLQGIPLPAAGHAMSPTQSYSGGVPQFAMQSNGAAGASLTAPSREGGKATQIMMLPPARVPPGRI